MFKKYKYEILIALLFILSRFPDLGHDMFNTDVWKWKSRSYDFGSGVFNFEFDKTIQKYHPGVTLMWLGTFGVKIYNLYHDTFLSTVNINSVTAVFGLNFVQMLLVVFTTAITLAFIFYVLNKLFGAKYAFFAVVLIMLEPFYTALTRTFHLEGMMSTFMMASILWFYYWLQDSTKKSRLILASFFAALSFLTKTSSLYLIPFFGLYSLITTYKKGQKPLIYIKETSIMFFKWLVPAIGFVFLFWPALWVNPLRVFEVLYKGVAVVGVELDHAQFFFNKYVEDPGILFYPVVLVYRSSLQLLFGVISFSFFLKKFLDNKNRKFISYLLIYTLFYLIELTIPSKKLDRYIMPAFLSLLLLSSFFYLWMLEKIKLNNVFKYGMFFLCCAIPMISIHPDYLSFYNPLMGGLKTGIFVIEPKWMIGQREIVSYFKQVQKDKNYKFSGDDVSFEKLIKNNTYDEVLTVGFPEKYYTQIWPFFREMGGWAVIQDLSGFAKYTRYFVYPVWEDTSKEENRFTLEFVGTIKLRGVDVYNVYIRK